MSRLNNVIRNTTAGYASQIIAGLMAFACRTVFIRQLGAAYLGINGLFTNVLGLLALAELGFGTAMNFEMYKPVAEGNYRKINTLLQLYKRVYHLIALVIAVIGLALIPFLHYLVKDPGDIGNIYVYYVLYLVNTLAGYYASYLYCLTNAEQKEYISSIITIVTTIVCNSVQMVVLILFKSFLGYLIVSTCSLLLQQIIIRTFFKRNYNHIFDIGSEELDIETKDHIKKNMGGLIVSKATDVLSHQTDNIIIALGLNIFTVGYADNYNLIVVYLKKLILGLLTSVVPSMGNMIATESQEKCYEVFRIYDMVDYYIYSFCTICMVALYQPFITLWAGSDKTISYWSMITLCVSFYLAGRNHAFLNYKTAYGVFHDIKITSIVSVILNLGLSVIGVKMLGLAGVYLGTCCSLLYSNIRTLRLAYRNLTGQSVRKYYLKRILQVLIMIPPCFVLTKAINVFTPEKNWLSFVVFMLVVVASSLIWITVISYKLPEFKGMIGIANESIKRIKHYRKGAA